MRHLSLKKHFRHPHFMDKHTMAVKLDHMVHDERFWGIVALVLLLGFIALAIWLSPEGTTDQPPGTLFKYY